MTLVRITAGNGFRFTVTAVGHVCHSVSSRRSCIRIKLAISHGGQEIDAIVIHVEIITVRFRSHLSTSLSLLFYSFLNFPQNFFNSQKRIRGFLLLLLLFDLVTRSFSNFSIASAYRFTITKFLRVSMFNTLLKTDLLYVSGFHDFVAKLIRIVLIVGIVFNMMIVWMRKKQLYKMKTDIQLALIGLCQVQWFVFERLHCQR